MLKTDDLSKSGFPLITLPVGETYSNGAISLNSGSVWVMLDASLKKLLLFISYFD